MGIAGWSGSGKTTLLTGLISLLSPVYQIACIKHAHHDFDIDHKNKDSYRHRKAGAEKIIIASAKRMAIIEEWEEELPLDNLLNHAKNYDIVFVEGYKKSPIPKIEIFRSILNKPPLWYDDNHIIAIACHEDISKFGHINNRPLLNCDDHQEIADFIIKYLRLSS